MCINLTSNDFNRCSCPDAYALFRVWICRLKRLARSSRVLRVRNSKPSINLDWCTSESTMMGVALTISRDLISIEELLRLTVLIVYSANKVYTLEPISGGGLGKLLTLSDSESNLICTATYVSNLNIVRRARDDTKWQSCFEEILSDSVFHSWIFGCLWLCSP